ncbi:MAG: DUF2851 family protein [Alistipes sp.]|nr:DUF2851 family protein [Alistipes sp.]
MALLQQNIVPKQCLDFVASLDDEARNDLLQHFCADRFLRKFNKVKDIFCNSAHDWNQTFYYMLLRTLDVGRNRKAFEQLALRVAYSNLLREHTSLRSIEAMVIGGSGLLEILDDDDSYIVSLKREAEHLLHKYNIEPLKPEDWSLSGVRPQNHPLLRLAQVAAFLIHHNFILSCILSCRTPKQVEKLFCIEPSPYWRKHFACDEDNQSALRLGREKANIFGINLIVPLQFTYSEFVGDNALFDHSIELLRALRPEMNKYTRQWYSAGILARNAYDSQALLQISTEFCQPRRCDKCRIGQHIAAMTSNEAK